MLTDLVRTIDIGVDARRSLSADTIGKIARMRTRDEDAAARRIRQLDREVADNGESPVEWWELDRSLTC